MPGHDFCCAPGCSNSRDPYDDSLKFHRIPAKVESRRVWIARINRADLREADVTDNTRLCSEHFFQGRKTPEQPHPIYFAHRTYPLARKAPMKRSRSSDDSRPPRPKRVHMPDIPTSCHDDCHEAGGEDTMEAAEGLLRLQDDFGAHRMIEDSPSVPELCPGCCAKDEQMSLLMKQKADLERQLDQQAAQSCTSVSRMDDKEVHYYTGLGSCANFRTLFEFLSPRLSELHQNKSSEPETPAGRRKILAPEDELLLVLMRLVKGLQVQDLAYRFGMKSNGHVSTLFRKWMHFLATELSDFVHWPSRAEVRKHLPPCFAKDDRFKRIRGIIDCTEFRIQIPSSISLNAMHFSNYKNDHTVKTLICITPDGFISLVSDAYPGSISDNSVTEKCGLLDMCEPGDKLLADKGFTVSNQKLQPRGLEVITPPFRDGDAQFSPEEVRATREIARRRIKSENAILRIKYCKYLKSRMTINSLSSVSDCIKVAAILANLRKPLG